jgi:hypothetical protein
VGSGCRRAQPAATLKTKRATRARCSGRTQGAVMEEDLTKDGQRCSLRFSLKVTLTAPERGAGLQALDLQLLATRSTRSPRRQAARPFPSQRPRQCDGARRTGQRALKSAAGRIGGGNNPPRRRLTRRLKVNPSYAAVTLRHSSFADARPDAEGRWTVYVPLPIDTQGRGARHLPWPSRH